VGSISANGAFLSQATGRVDHVSATSNDHVARARIKHYTDGVEQDDVATYRAMRPEERLALALELSALCWAWLDVPDREAGDRKWAAWQREHDRSNESLLAGLAKHRRESES
jgi:hypothetical protein